MTKREIEIKVRLNEKEAEHLNQQVEKCRLSREAYVVERVFTGTKTIQEVVTEEIIFTGKQAASFDQQDSRMV